MIRFAGIEMIKNVLSYSIWHESLADCAKLELNLELLPKSAISSQFALNMEE